MPGRGVSIAALAICGVGTVLLPAPQAALGAEVVPKPTCQQGDRPETALQGQVPWSDRVSGRAALGYSCNLREIGGFGAVDGDPTQQKLAAWANFDTYEHCAYYSDGNDGTIVLDVSHPTHPVQTAYLMGGAMASPWESLRVNARRGLLVADHQPTAKRGGGDAPGSSPLDVYDVSKDCAHPRKLFSGALPDAVGHEGWFQPDGMVYYASNLQQVVPVDLSDPRHPKELGVWAIPAHGGSVSDDGTRGYFCVNAVDTEVLVVDTSEVQQRRANARFKEISTIPLPDTQACQATYPVTYHGRPYLIQFGEMGETAGTVCPTQSSTFSRPHIIDISDERHPKVVSTLMNEVAMAGNCPKVIGDRTSTLNVNGQQPYSAFVYGTHMCDPDRLHDPTILACAEWLSGVRVYDIRDPLKAKEIAYFNPGTLSSTDLTVDMAAARPVIRPDLGEIWYSSTFGGFHVLKFEAGVYRSAPACPTQADWFVDQYDPTTSARCASHAAPAARVSSRRPSRPSTLTAQHWRGAPATSAVRFVCPLVAAGDVAVGR